LARSKRPSHTNRLLDGLPHKERQRFLAGCEHVELELGKTLAKPGKALRYVYFPTESYLSLITELEGGACLDVALVGNEGMLGVPLVLGIDVSPVRVVVQKAGPAWRMSAAQFRQALGNGSALRPGLHSYLFVRMRQLGQTAGCTRFHVVQQRLARWLLMIADRGHSETFRMTHELLACALGVRRVGVTKAATSLQNRKLISYTRGNITIRNRRGLEAASCGCYHADRDTYDRMMGVR